MPASPAWAFRWSIIWTSFRSFATRCCRGLNASVCARGAGRARRCRRDGDALNMKDDEDDRPKKKITHEIGQDLYLLSVKELEERIALLTDEIERLRTTIRSKQSSRDAADSFFKK